VPENPPDSLYADEMPAPEPVERMATPDQIDLLQGMIKLHVDRPGERKKIMDAIAQGLTLTAAESFP
jgi:hypothetical protein